MESADQGPVLETRPLDFSDLSDLVSLEREIFGADAWSRALVRGELDSPWSHYIGLFIGEQMVAYGGVKGDVEGDLMTMGVKPSMRGRGLGRILLKSLIDVARQEGFQELFLEVRASNLPARHLYTEEGFQELGEIPAYYRNPVEDAVTMRKTIQ